MSELIYIEAMATEWIGRHCLGIKILVSLDRDLTAADDRAIRSAQDLLHAALTEETYRLDPDVQKERVAERQAIKACFPDQALIYVHETQNQYCNRACCSQRPWFYVTTPAGLITIGWRKRVIEIRWETGPTSKFTKTAEELFPAEDVTKSSGSRDGKRSMIHAWGYEKAREYIAALLGSVEHAR